MNRFDYCTFILLGHTKSNDEAFSAKINKLCRAVTNHEISIFDIEKSKLELTRGNSPQALTLKNVIASGRPLQKYFYDIMIETFLHKARSVGPVVFANFPKQMEHVRCLTKALTLFGRDMVVVLNFNSGMSESVNEVALYLKGNPKYIYLDVQDEDQLKPPYDDLAKEFSRLV